MVGTFTTDHIDNVAQDLSRTKHRSIHPTASLLHQIHHRFWRVCESLCIRNISQFKSVTLLYVNLEAHDPIFCQVLIGLSTSGYIGVICLFLALVFEKLFQWCSFNSFPAEQAICTREHLREPEERFTHLIRGMAQLVFIELS